MEIRKNSSVKFIKVWSLYIRFFHWGLVLLMFGMYVTAELKEFDLHEYFGYALGTLLLSRFVIGITASGHAGFRNSIFGPKETVLYIVSLFKHEKRRYVGHDPAGGFWIMALLFGSLYLVMTGMALLGWMDYLGPLSFMADRVSHQVARVVETMHFMGSTIFLAMIAVHVSGVAFMSFLNKENLIWGMFTGMKKSRPGDINLKSDTPRLSTEPLRKKQKH